MKLRRKLLASAVAIASCAATLTTATYAWYTTNAEVTASGINAGSAASGDSSIFISKTGSDGTWKTGVDFQNDTTTYYTSTSYASYLSTKDESDLAACTETTHKHDGSDTGNTCIALPDNKSLVPVQLLGDGTFALLDNSKENCIGGTSSAVYTIDLYFKTAKTANDVNLYIESYYLRNAASSLTAVDNLLVDTTVASGTTDTVGVDRTRGSYAVDICNCLGMKVEASDTAGTKNYIDLSNTYSAGTGTQIIASTNVGANGGAIGYYNEVMDLTTPIAPAATATSKTEAADLGKTLMALSTLNFNADSRTKIATLPAAGTPVKVTFTIFLNGWDAFCYDACKGQNFIIDLAFTSTK